MKYQCLKCSIQWEDGIFEEDQQDLSHGFCLRCIRELLKPFYIKKQIKLGIEPCYASNKPCFDENCVYRETCIIKGD